MLAIWSFCATGLQSAVRSRLASSRRAFGDKRVDSSRNNIRSDALDGFPCECLKPVLGRCEYDGRELGIDHTHGRFGEVWLYTCPHCTRIWLFYRVEYEAFTASGRWYRAIVSKETADTVTPATAADAIAGSDYKIRGGSFFNTAGQVIRGAAPITVDLF